MEGHGHAEVQGLLAQLKLEEKIKEGAENMLHEFNEQKYKMTSQHKKQVVVQLEAASSKISSLKSQLEALGHIDEGGYSPINESPPTTKQEPVNILRSLGGSTSSLNLQPAPPRRRSLTNDSSPLQFSVLFDSLDYREDVQVSSSKVSAIETLLLNYPLLRTEFAIGQMFEKLRPFLQSPDSLVLAIGFHLCRVLTNSKAAIMMMRQHLSLDYYIIRSLSKTDANAEYTERVQVLQLVQAVLEIHDGVEEISQGVIRAIVAVAEQASDKLRDWSLATIGQVAICDPRKAFDAGAITVMVDMLLDGPRDVAVSIAYVFCSLLDSPENRTLLRDGKDLNFVLSIFTGGLVVDDQQPELTTERLQITIEVVCIIINSWAGLMCFDLKSLVQCLLIPSRVIQNAILDIFIYSLGTTPEKLGEDTGELNEHFRNHFAAYLLQRLFDEKLHDFLYSLRSDMKFHSAIREKANRLSGYMIRIASLILPHAFISRSTSLPESLSEEFNKARQLQIPAAGWPIFQMNKAIRAPERLKISRMQYSSQTPSSSRHAVIELGQDSKVWIKMGSQMDEIAFRQLMNATNVLSTKNFPRWNWDALLELIQGPLHNPKRLDEACRSTKFMKRLMSFYRPFKYRFSSVKNTPQNRKYVHVGKELILTLLETPEGVRFLGSNKVLRQIAECLAQLDPNSGITSSEPLLSTQRVRATLTYGYFEIIGVMTRSQQGLNILSQLKVFNMLYNICDTERTDVIRQFLTSLEFNLNGHPRLILAKALVRGTKPVRIYATKFLQTLGERGRNNWVIDLLVTQLYDVDVDVCKIAVSVLLELSRDTEYLDHFISLKPNLEHLGPMGDSIYIVFMSRPEGYKYLSGFDFVSHEMDEWVHGYNETYVKEIEEYLGPENLLSRPPRHFFGELVLTEEGSKLLSERDYISSFQKFINNHGGSQSPQILIKLKGYMWALGYIASKPLGASLITPEIVQSICDVYIQSQVYSVRGTALYALGLVASSFEGAEILNQSGWATAVSPFGDQIGVALVLNIEEVKGCNISSFSDGQDGFDFGPDHQASGSDTPTAEERQLDLTSKEILGAISDLSNQILANDASKKLVTLRSQYEESFKSTELFKSMMELLEKYRYKQLARRFLFEIFDTKNIIDKMARKRVHKTVISRPN